MIEKIKVLYIFILYCFLAAKSCRTLCDPIDCSQPGSSVQARILEWVAISFSVNYTYIYIYIYTHTHTAYKHAVYTDIMHIK